MPNLGNAAIGADVLPSSFGKGDFQAIKVYLPTLATFGAMQAYLINVSGYANTMYWGIASDNAGEPGTAIGSASYSVPSSGSGTWRTVYTPSAALLWQPGWYWFCWILTNTASGDVTGRYDTESGIARYKGGTLTAFSVPTGCTVGNQKFSVYIPYTAVFDASKWTLYPQLLFSTGVWTMEEGVTPAERSRSTATTRTVNCGTAAFVDVASYRLPMPRDQILKAGTYAVVIRVWGVATCNTRAVLDVDSGATTFASASANPAAAEADQLFTITVGADTNITSLLQLKFQGQGVSAAKDVTIRPVHANVRFGPQSTGCLRTLFAGSALTPSPGSHAGPVIVSGVQPYFNTELQGVYPDDVITLKKYTDTLASAGHSASSPVSQVMGAAQYLTDALPVLSTRRIDSTAASDQKTAALNNTYYELLIADAVGNTVGTLSWELLLGRSAASLVTPKGATSGTAAITEDLEPWLEWTDPNPDTTHWRVKVYRTSDNALMWDSTETAAAATKVQIPSSASLLSLTGYYWVVTLMNGSGGAGWTIDSARGYFQIDKTTTGIKITSPQGTADNPEIITDTTPTVEWYFGRDQHSYNIQVIDQATGLPVYSSGWVASTDKEHTIE